MRLLGASLVAAAALLATPASALIVVDGKIVSQWPDQPARVGRGSSAAQLAAEGLGFYPDPKGVVNGLTVLVDFSDASPAFSVEEVAAWLNEPGFSEDGLNGSVRDYYFDNSNGHVDLQNQVVGFYRASRPKSYYEAATDYSRAGELVEEVFEAIDADVDFSLFDNDGDGRTEALSIVFAGDAENWAQGLWPHSGYINQMRDGVRLSRYQMTAMRERFSLYTFVHEVGHMLFGWPDLYGFGNYCAMGNASDQENPVGINDFYRADQGWIPLIDLTAQTNGRFYANVNAGGYRYVNPERPEEAFFWSNVQNVDRWSTLRGNGLLVLHFDGDIDGNEPPNTLSLAVVQADGQRELDEEMWPEPGSEQADFYTASGSRELSASTNPSSAWNEDSASGLKLYDVSASGESMTFTVGTGTPEPGIGGAGGTGGIGMAGAPTAGAAGASVGGAAGASSGGTAGSAGMAASAGMPTGGAGGEMAGTGGGAIAGNAGSSGAMASSGGAAAVAGTSATLGGSTSAGTTGGALAGTSGAPTGGPTGGAPSGGAAMSAAPQPEATPDQAGCGCRVPTSSRPDASSLYGLLVAVMALLRRRTRRFTSSAWSEPGGR
jgi:M6 family metalloprotease-like protein